ncbi:hypothetical protein GW17_00006880 [Ensete ventricosum]|nr:hypothetical protein GW17_00006880 [Ensete ventricosum]
MGAHREFAEHQSRFGRCCRELTRCLSEVRREFADRLQELAGCSPKEYWKFIGSSPKKIESSLGVHRKDAGISPKRRLDNEHCSVEGSSHLQAGPQGRPPIARPLVGATDYGQGPYKGSQALCSVSHATRGSHPWLGLPPTTTVARRNGRK